LRPTDARLSRGEARVTELAAPFDISLNSVSKHIRILERADLVRHRVSRRGHFLTFDAAPMESAAGHCGRASLSKRCVRSTII
jgi:hypothetical protein